MSKVRLYILQTIFVNCFIELRHREGGISKFVGFSLSLSLYWYIFLRTYLCVLVITWIDIPISWYEPYHVYLYIENDMICFVIIVSWFKASCVLCTLISFFSPYFNCSPIYVFLNQFNFLTHIFIICCDLCMYWILPCIWNLGVYF